MLYAVLCYHHEAEVMGWTPAQDAAVRAKRAKVQQKIAAAGKLGPVARLMPTTAATTVRLGREPVVIDGPFAETKELIAGYWIIQAKSMAEAIAWATRAPNPSGNEESEIEIRQFFEMEDFAPSPAVERAFELGKELAKTKKQAQ
jgi:hypothetical protein